MVAGLSGTICGMYASTEREANRPEQVVFGFTERFRAAMEARGGITAPQKYGKTWTVTHDPLAWREVADGFLADAGVRVLFHSLVVGVIMENNRVLGIAVDSKAGRGAVHAKTVIDASGDGVQVGVRQTRSINDVERLTNDDVVVRRKRPDGVVRLSWLIELHSGERPKLEWIHDDYYEGPFDALLPEKGENLITTERCLSAEHEALTSAWVTAQCFGYGNATGLAAVTGQEFRELLDKDGARLSE